MYFSVATINKDVLNIFFSLSAKVQHNMVLLGLSDEIELSVIRVYSLIKPQGLKSISPLAKLLLIRFMKLGLSVCRHNHRELAGWIFAKLG